jgi:hypothetical protein
MHSKSKTPNISRAPSFATADELGRCIVRRPSIVKYWIHSKNGGSEVANLRTAVLAKKNILWFDIEMQDSLGMDIL